MRYEGVNFTLPTVGTLEDQWRWDVVCITILSGHVPPITLTGRFGTQGEEDWSVVDLRCVCTRHLQFVLYPLSLLGLWRRPKKNVHHACWCSCQGADACRRRQDFEACTAWKANQEGQGLHHPGEDSESQGEGRCPGTHGTSGDSSSFLSLTRHPGPTQRTVGHPPSATTALEHHWADLHRAQGRPQEGT
jgi:hypothetical protein